MRYKGSHVFIIQLCWIMERDVPYHCASPFKELSRVTKTSALEEEEIYPTWVQDDRQCRVSGTVGWREPDDEAGVAVADQFDSAGN